MRVATLICKRDLESGTQCLLSLARCAQFSFELTIFEDGSLSQEQRLHLKNLFDRATVVSRGELESQVGKILQNRPNCSQYRREHPLALKLIDIPLYLGADHLFCDTDILFFRRFKIQAAVTEDPNRCIFMRDPSEGYSARMWDLLLKHRLAMPSRLNSGFWWLPWKRYDLDFIEWFLGQPEFKLFPQLVEQTCWAALSRNNNIRFWDTRQVFCAGDAVEVTENAVAVHFYYYHKSKIAQFLSQAASTAETLEPVELGVEKPARLNIARALRHTFTQRRKARMGKV